MNTGQFNKACMDGLIGNVMQAAVRDYMKEMEAESEAAASRGPAQTDFEELFDDDDDPELEALHRRRLAKLKAKAEKQRDMLTKGHGSYREIVEEEFLKEVTGSKHVVVHFYHPDFTRCKVVDKHLFPIAAKYLECKFLKLNVDKAPFFVGKLQIKVLPAVLLFEEGVCKDRIVGFDELGARDDFEQEVFEKRLDKGGAIKYRIFTYNPDSDDEAEVRVFFFILLFHKIPNVLSGHSKEQRWTAFWRRR